MNSKWPKCLPYPMSWIRTTALIKNYNFTSNFLAELMPMSDFVALFAPWVFSAVLMAVYHICLTFFFFWISIWYPDSYEYLHRRFGVSKPTRAWNPWDSLKEGISALIISLIAAIIAIVFRICFAILFLSPEVELLANSLMMSISACVWIISALLLYHTSSDVHRKN